jgi:integrase/recombinase XerD
MRYSRSYINAVGPFYRPNTVAVMERGLYRIGVAFSDLRAAGKVSTENPEKLTLDDVVAFLIWMRSCPIRNGNGLQAGTQENYFEYLLALLKWVENPVVLKLMTSGYIRLPRRSLTEIRVLSEGVLRRLQSRLEKMPGWEGCVARFMVAMYAFAGLRRSELRLARLRDLDMKNWRILVVHPKGEGAWASTSVATILPPARQNVRDFLKERKEYLASCGFGECEPLVPRVWSNGRVDYWTDAMWGKTKGRAERLADMQFRIGELRATFAQMCKDRGASIEVVSRALRHRYVLTTEMYYARMRPDAAFRELEGLFASKAEKQSRFE